MSNSEPNTKQAAQATPREELERRIMDPNIPKNEQEHWAVGEIHRLRDLLNGGCPMHPSMPDQRSITDQLIDIVRVAERAGYYDGADWIKRQVMAQTDRKIAEVSEPRKCVQTVNVFGRLLAMPCEQMRTVTAAEMGDPHEKSRNYCISSPTDCLHHEPLYVAPSDVSNDGYIVTPQGEGYCRESMLPFTRCGEAHQHIGVTAGRQEILEALTESRAALTDAERKLADAEDRLRDTSESHAATDKVVFDLYDKLAAAEQRAKDAEASAEFRWLTMEREAADAAMIRKLATAREQFFQIKSIDCACDGCRGYVRTMAQRGLAAIDAPAGEEAPEAIPPRIIDGKFMAAVQENAGRRAVVIVKISSGEIVPEDEPLMLQRGRDHLMLPMLHYYRKLSELDGCNDYHMAAVDRVIAQFTDYASDPSRMKQPGITRGAAWNPGAPAAELLEPLLYRTCERILCLAVSAIGAECTLHRDPPHSRHIGVQAEWTDAPPPDAPAGEERVGPSDWCLAVTCSSCGARCQRKIGHGFGVPHAGACAANCRNAPPHEPANALPIGYVECSDCDAQSNYHRDGVTHCEACGWPPSDCEGHQPANAQGSEAGDGLPEPHEFCGGDGCNMCKASSVPPFTAEEARERARAEAMMAARCERDVADDSGNEVLLTAATEHHRKTESWRRYAAMLERDDALERAAKRVMWAFRNRGDVDRRAAIDNLDSTLQRAKDRA